MAVTITRQDVSVGGLRREAGRTRDAVRWRCVDLQERIKREWGIGLHERTVGKLLRKLAFQRLSVRPQHPKSDPAAQAVFRTGSRAL